MAKVASQLFDPIGLKLPLFLHQMHVYIHYLWMLRDENVKMMTICSWNRQPHRKEDTDDRAALRLSQCSDILLYTSSITHNKLLTALHISVWKILILDMNSTGTLGWIAQLQLHALYSSHIYCWAPEEWSSYTIIRCLHSRDCLCVHASHSFIGLNVCLNSIYDSLIMETHLSVSMFTFVLSTGLLTKWGIKQRNKYSNNCTGNRGDRGSVLHRLLFTV